MMKKILDYRKRLADRRNRERLENRTPTLISSNCTAGVLYHMLGLEFRSPFINLWMTNDDFLTAMENLEQFLATPLREDTDAGLGYPVGIGYGDTRIYFLHYGSWQEAEAKWRERLPRIDTDNMGIMLSNIDMPGAASADRKDILRRFDRLPMRHKVVFTPRPEPDIESAVCLRGWHPEKGRNVFDTRKLRRTRYIDDYDYVGFINSLKEPES